MVLALDVDEKRFGKAIIVAGGSRGTVGATRAPRPCVCLLTDNNSELADFHSDETVGPGHRRVAVVKAEAEEAPANPATTNPRDRSAHRKRSSQALADTTAQVEGVNGDRKRQRLAEKSSWAVGQVRGGGYTD